MRRAGAGRRREPPLGAGGGSAFHPGPRKPQPGSGTPWLLLLSLLAFGVSSCKAAPMASHSPQGEHELQMWNEINDVCSTYLTRDTSPQSSNTLEDLCIMVLELLQKTQDLDEKDNTKRFLFHYTKTHETGNSNILDELRIPGGIQSRGYFIFRVCRFYMFLSLFLINIFIVFFLLFYLLQPE
uniref:Neuromedin-U isoform X4 n=1 Tax=Pogona vitticeps TaxID=103695 RepID=A0ABM5GI64_9SAUR